MLPGGSLRKLAGGGRGTLICLEVICSVTAHHLLPWCVVIAKEDDKKDYLGKDHVEQHHSEMCVAELCVRKKMATQSWGQRSSDQDAWRGSTRRTLTIRRSHKKYYDPRVVSDEPEKNETHPRQRTPARVASPRLLLHFAHCPVPVRHVRNVLLLAILVLSLRRIETDTLSASNGLSEFIWRVRKWNSPEPRREAERATRLNR